MMSSDITEKTPWQHDLDAKKYMLQVHMDFKRYLGVDFKLAKLDDKDREFIMTILTAGIFATDICPNPDVGEQIKEMDYAYINTISVLKFNLPGNPVLDRFTKWEEKEVEQQEEETFIKRLGERISGKKKPKEVDTQGD